jgi:hypothetical protein
MTDASEKIERLKEALTPFAMAYTYIVGLAPDAPSETTIYRFQISEHESAYLYRGDFQKAFEALEAIP